MHRLIGGRHGLTNIRPGCGHAQNAPTIGDQRVCLAFGAGMKNRPVLPVRELLQSGNRLSLLIAARIASGREHDTHRGAVVPVEAHLVEAFIDRGLHDFDQV